MFDKQVEKLGTKLAQAFETKAREYFTKASATADVPTKTNMLVMGAVLGEVSRVIADVTKREAE